MYKGGAPGKVGGSKSTQETCEKSTEVRRVVLKGRLIMLVLLDGSMWEGAPLYTCSHQDISDRRHIR
jgi:hypothetical protein